MQAAARERAAAGWEYEAQRRKVLRDAACAFADVLAAQRRVELAEEGLRIAAEVRDAIVKAVETGAAPALETTGARIAHARARSERVAASEALIRARAALAAMWGDAESRFVRAEGELRIDAVLAPLEDLRARIARHPELRRAEEEVATREVLAALERAKRVPSVTVRAGYRRLESERVDTFVAAIGLPLPIFDRNRGGIEEADARRARAEWLRAARARELDAALAQTHAKLSAAIEEEEAYEKEILPGTREAFDASQDGYMQRTIRYHEFLTAEENLLRARKEHLEVLLRLHQAWTELEFLTGMAPGTKGVR